MATEAADRIARWKARLASLPSIALPTDYPRPQTSQLVQAITSLSLSSKANTALVRLAIHQDHEGDFDDQSSDDEDNAGHGEGVSDHTPTPFHLLLAAFAVLLHRYTGDTDLVIATSSPTTGEPLILRIPIEPGDPFWQIVRRVQAVEAEAASDAVPYLDIVRAMEEERVQREGVAAEGAPPSAPLFRVRFFDETGGTVSNFRQSTSLTTDLTVYVTRPGIKVGFEVDSASPSSSSVSGTTVVEQSKVPSLTSSASSAAFRTPLVPAISLHLSYNSLLFSSARMSTLLSHLSHVLVTAASNPAAAVGSMGIRTSAEAAFLPDPRKDLEWCGFRGSITSIFENNARAFPDRRCLVESQSAPAGTFDLPAPASSLREVTYGQLDRASNVVAHHLLLGGVQREEVVTVYAHRGVDLVVAVLGTLKAGATFSVIDPAYPPSRQNVYLQVAKPRALVILAKAGVLHPSVRQCIQAELDIRVEIPALELTAEGIVRGGAFKGVVDTLDAAQEFASQSTNVTLGPDSVGTLSFTSGSTGIPKGVRGRHFSLTHFFPWMGERFGLSEKERFTMLSGIAHDPIQRDIFTPLFFGAELHIPTAEDIGTPGRLAEWMAASQATVTHLTPAMGQLLSAQAVAQIPSLRNAFFVGDVLTKRDCTRLQALASNVRIVNMYGTTETQRAVSYFAIPPVSENSTFLQTQKDIMPAGQGMINVQLLVVNRHERTTTCAIGEVGEIYVRSGGLAEGYLGPATVSAEKFLPNFLAPDLQWPDSIKGSPEGQYWHGVRDRMYRTGDLGRYLPDGTVECTGRADDQVKIRGFRIELGEIDTHLSQHPHVRENVTLVRRDKDEEKVLVSYFVPGPGAAALQEASSADEDGDVEVSQSRNAGLVRGMRRHRGLIKDIRDYLKKKLPAYSVPTLFVPLGRMPLNPNGKIDKPALPFPDTAVGIASTSTVALRAHGASSEPVVDLSPTESTLRGLWSKLLPSAPHPIPLNESFFDLGGHSILATRLVFEMRKAFVAPIPLGLVFDAPTVSALAREVDRMRDNDLGLEGVDRSTRDNHSALANFSLSPANTEEDYAGDVDVLAPMVPSHYSATLDTESARTVLLTGATGFLGAFILRDLLTNRATQVKIVIAHVRARDAAAGFKRLREGGQARGAWSEDWIEKGRLQVVVGDLAAKERLGLDVQTWATLENEVDDIIHNGALVHWVYPYSKLRAANVGSTICGMALAAKGRAKTFTFVSSTSALDTEHYVNLSDNVLAKRLASSEAAPLLGVPETDDLEGSAKGLGTGYGQSKWVAERLVMLGASRGLRASIVRPGYVVGDSASAVTNTDDFLWRLVKGSTQLGRYPDMHNVVNMVPVDHVARVAALAALALSKGKEGLPTPDQRVPSTHAIVYHVTGHPPIRFNDLLEALEVYGWDVQRTDYVQWRALLEEHVLKSGADSDNALFPLLHFVLDDLPTSTKAPELDDRHTSTLLALAKESATENVVRGVDASLVAVYLSWLVEVGFLTKPTREGCKPLPVIEMGTLKAIGRGSAN